MRKIRVLLADDDRDFAESLAEILELRGIDVELAYNGKEAFDKVVDDSIDALLLDLRMPIMNGLEVYEGLLARGLKLPTIVITAYIDEFNEKYPRSEDFPIDNVVSKPVEPGSLIDLILSMFPDECLTNN